jgi:hypothetical protein
MTHVESVDKPQMPAPPIHSIQVLRQIGGGLLPSSIRIVGSALVWGNNTTPVDKKQSLDAETFDFIARYSPQARPAESNYIFFRNGIAT